MNASSGALPDWILGKRSLNEFTAVMKAVVGFFSKSGLDVSFTVRRLARAKFPEFVREGSLESSELEVEKKIAECYSRLRALAATENHGDYARTISHLRELQESEALRLASVFHVGRQIEPAAAEKALRRADELLTAHEDPPGED